MSSITDTTSTLAPLRAKSGWIIALGVVEEISELCAAASIAALRQRHLRRCPVGRWLGVGAWWWMAGGGWGWGGAGLGFAAGALVGSALTSPYYGYGYGYAPAAYGYPYGYDYGYG